MLLPDNFTGLIAETFYDKTVNKLTKTKSSTDGWVEETGTVNTSFKANVQFDNLGQIQSEMGLTEQIDVVMTCASDVNLTVDDLFSYHDVTYKTSAILPRDSHKKVAGQKWA
jgi:hypothetical protein